MSQSHQNLENNLSSYPDENHKFGQLFSPRSIGDFLPRQAIREDHVDVQSGTNPNHEKQHNHPKMTTTVQSDYVANRNDSYYWEADSNDKKYCSRRYSSPRKSSYVELSSRSPLTISSGKSPRLASRTRSPKDFSTPTSTSPLSKSYHSPGSRGNYAQDETLDFNNQYYYSQRSPSASPSRSIFKSPSRPAFRSKSQPSSRPLSRSATRPTSRNVSRPSSALRHSRSYTPRDSESSVPRVNLEIIPDASPRILELSKPVIHDYTYPEECSFKPKTNTKPAFQHVTSRYMDGVNSPKSSNEDQVTSPGREQLQKTISPKKNVRVSPRILRLSQPIIRKNVIGVDYHPECTFHPKTTFYRDDV